MRILTIIFVEIAITAPIKDNRIISKDHSGNDHEGNIHNDYGGISTVVMSIVIIVITITIAIVATITTTTVITGIMAMVTVVMANSRPTLSLYIDILFTLLNEEYSLKTFWMYFNKHLLFDLKIHSYFSACPILIILLPFIGAVIAFLMNIIVKIHIKGI